MNLPDSNSRFSIWAFAFVFSLIVIIDLSKIETDADYNQDDKTAKSDKAWSLALSIISMLVTIFFFCAHISHLKAIVIGNKIEAWTIVVLLIFWSVLVSLITGPNRGLAVDQEGGVNLGNLYYVSWAGFLCICTLGSMYVEDVFGINVRDKMKQKSNSFLYWSGLLVASLIVMGTCSDLYDSNCDVGNDDKPQPFCRRTVYGIVVGALGTIFSLAIVVMKLAFAAPFLIEVGTAGFLFILYIFEVAFLTTPNGPGSPLGNLYYFSWLSFGLTFMVGKTCREDYLEALNEIETQRVDRHMPSLDAISNEDYVNVPPPDNNKGNTDVNGDLENNVDAVAPTPEHAPSVLRSPLSQDATEEPPKIFTISS